MPCNTNYPMSLPKGVQTSEFRLRQLGVWVNRAVSECLGDDGLDSNSSGSIGGGVAMSLVQPKEIVTNLRIIDNTVSTPSIDYFPTGKYVPTVRFGER